MTFYYIFLFWSLVLCSCLVCGWFEQIERLRAAASSVACHVGRSGRASGWQCRACDHCTLSWGKMICSRGFSWKKTFQSGWLVDHLRDLPNMNERTSSPCVLFFWGGYVFVGCPTEGDQGPPWPFADDLSDLQGWTTWRPEENGMAAGGWKGGGLKRRRKIYV